MHNTKVELQGKCRRLFYSKVDLPVEPGGHQVLQGDVLGIASGGGAMEGLTGEELIIATFNDHTAAERIGCIEQFYNPIPATSPTKVDLAKIQACGDAVDAHRAATKAEAEFVFERSIKLFGSESLTTTNLQHVLKVQEMHTRDKPDRTADHDGIVQAQTDLEALCKTCEDCCEQLLVTRDAAVTFAEPES